jgi:hypothetical protein
MAEQRTCTERDDCFHCDGLEDDWWATETAWFSLCHTEIVSESSALIVRSCGGSSRGEAQAEGVFSAEELANWWAQLEQAEAAGQLYLALFGFVVGGRKPQLVYA